MNSLLWDYFLNWCTEKNIRLTSPQVDVACKILYENEGWVNFISGRQTGKSFLAQTLVYFMPERFKIVVPSYDRKYFYRVFKGIETLTPGELHGRHFETIIFDDYEEMDEVNFQPLANQEIAMMYGEYQSLKCLKKEAGEWDE